MISARTPGWRPLAWSVSLNVCSSEVPAGAGQQRLEKFDERRHYQLVTPARIPVEQRATHRLEGACLRGQQFVDAFGQQPGVCRMGAQGLQVSLARREQAEAITATPGMSQATVGSSADLRVGSRLQVRDALFMSRFGFSAHQVQQHQPGQHH